MHWCPSQTASLLTAQGHPWLYQCLFFTMTSFCLPVLIAPGNVNLILEVYLNSPWLVIM